MNLFDQIEWDIAEVIDYKEDTPYIYNSSNASP